MQKSFDASSWHDIEHQNKRIKVMMALYMCISYNHKAYHHISETPPFRIDIIILIIFDIFLPFCVVETPSSDLWNKN